MSWCVARKFHSHKHVIGHFLALLQSGIEFNLALSTIKGQTSALESFFFRDQLLLVFGLFYHL